MYWIDPNLRNFHIDMDKVGNFTYSFFSIVKHKSIVHAPR